MKGRLAPNPATTTTGAPGHGAPVGGIPVGGIPVGGIPVGDLPAGDFLVDEGQGFSG